MKKSVSEIKVLEVRGSVSNLLFRFGLALIGFEFLSGLWLILENGLSIRVMSLVLAHAFLGYLLVVSLVMLVRRHLLYRKAWPSTWYDFCAILSASMLFVGLISGMWIHWFGFAGAKWIWWTHLLSSFAHVFFLTIYVIQTIRSGSADLSKILKKKFFYQLFKISITIFATLALIVGVFETIQSIQQFPDPNKTVPDYSFALGISNNFYPSSFKTSSGGFYKEGFYTNSQSCGGSGCHGETVKQWLDSTHYRTPGPFVLKAGQNLFEEGQDGSLFRKVPSTHFEMIRKAKPGREVFRMCSGCHAPVALLSGHIDPKVPMASFEKFEGVSCKVCHTMRENEHPMPGPGNYEVTPSPMLFFENWSSPIGQHFYRTLIRTRPDDHKKMFMRPGYKDPKICSSCHFTNQYESWAKGPYHNENDRSQTKTCQDCHMPQVKTDHDISAASKGTIADHRYLSAGFTMAKYFGLEEQYKKTEAFMQDEKMKVQILAPTVAPAKSPVTFTARVSNIGVGHFFPSGPEADLVEAWVQIDVFGDNQEIISRFGVLDENNYLDEKSNRIWRVTNLDNLGRELEKSKHRSWKFAVDILDVIPPKEFSDVSFTIPKSKVKNLSRLLLKARLMYRRPNQAFADWALGPGTFKVPSAIVATDQREIQLSTDRNLWVPAATIYQSDVTKFELGLKPTLPVPTRTYRAVVEDALIVRTSKNLLNRGEAGDARVLLNQVSPMFFKSDPTWQSFHQKLLKEAETKKISSPTPVNMNPGY